MPPRRSTRSARQSIEPQPHLASESTAKRKRGQSSAPDQEKENVEKPTRSRRPTSAAPPSRTSTRSRPSLKEVPESDEEEEEEEEEEERKPRVKRSRPSRDVVAEAEDDKDNDKDDEDAYEEQKSKKPASSRKPTTRRVSRSKVVKEEEKEDEVIPEPTPSTRSNGRAPRGSRGKRVSSVVKEEVKAPTPPPREKEEEEEEESDEDATPKPPSAGPSHASSSHARVSPIPEEPETEEAILDNPPMRPPKTTTIPTHSNEEESGVKKRLVIHKMALVNFKSYAGRQEIGPFHKSFSSIVGPNGSGKSNTIDALLFVFGYRANKMRQGKLSELIHNSARYPNLDECSVEVHFREIVDLPGPDAYEIVENSQLIVTRTAYKNNTSKYTINNRQSTFTEVQTLLKGRGIDLDHKRFLILQGEVESIAQMKPKAQTEHDEGLLEYLEDIIGTSKYKEPIEQALAEVDTLTEERTAKLSRLRHVEKDKMRLEKDKREAEGYIRLQNEWIRAKSRLWQYYIFVSLREEEKLQRQIDVHKKELEAETERNKADIEHITKLEKHLVERTKLYEDVKVAANDALSELAVNEKAAVSLEERRKHASSKLKKLKKSLAEDETSQHNAQRSYEDNTEKIASEKAKIEEQEENLEREEKVLEGIRDSLKDKTQVYHDQIEVKQKELEPWRAKINAKKSEIDVATSERDALQKKAEVADAARTEAAEALEALRVAQEEKTQDIKTAQANKATLEKRIQEGTRKLEATQRTLAGLRAAASSARNRVDEAKASQAANTSQGKVLDYLNSLKAQGRISGFHGRLGSLGTIPEKYDTAITTACPGLNNLVVDTVDAGQKCIEYLRTHNVGRASFFVLEKLPQNAPPPIQTPEGVPRLYDLIKPKDPRFCPAFYKALSDTLVANDLEQANRIAFGARRYRVVTLSGELIDTSGTMSGGGSRPQRGGMSSKFAAESVPADVMRKYQQDSEQATIALEDALKGVQGIESELEEHQRMLPETELLIQKTTMEIKAGTARIAEAEKHIQNLKSQSKPNTGYLARIDGLNEEIDKATAALDKLQAKSDTIDASIKELEQKILQIGGSKLLAQKSKVDGIRLHIKLANDELTKAEVAKAKAEKDIAKLATSIESSTETIEEVDQDLSNLVSELEEANKYVRAVKKTVEQAQNKVEEAKQDMDSIKEELDEKNEQIEEYRQKEQSLKQAITDNTRKAKEFGDNAEHWTEEHDKLQLNPIDPENDDDEDEAANSRDNQASSSTNGTDPERNPKSKHDSSPEDELALTVYDSDVLKTWSKDELIADEQILDEKLKTLLPNVDLSVLSEYKKREEEFLRRAKDLEDVTNRRDEQKIKYDSLRKQRLDEFMTGFSLISLKLKEMYQMITLGGNAELELVDSMDPFSEGIIFSVMPPKKSWKNISNLSGGEKTLSSLALVFALHVFKPTPLYFMDEIDAALDFRNVSIVANYIKDRTKNAQFIIISLRNDMFELSHRLIGIYKTGNATQSIAIDNHALTHRSQPSQTSTVPAG